MSLKPIEHIIFTRYFWNLIITSLFSDIFVFSLNWKILPLYNKFVSNLIAYIITKADIYGDFVGALHCFNLLYVLISFIITATSIGVDAIALTF